MNGRVEDILSWLVTVLVPFFLILLGVRLLLNPLFPEFEYRTPNFPEDTYGFTFEDRLHWSKISIEYLLNDSGIEFLGDLRFQDGSRVYNDRELKHMLDVKILVQIAFRVWYAALGGLILLGIWAWRGNWMASYRNGLSRGGWWTAVLVGLILVFTILSFNVFFVFFHRVFFEGDSWLFQFSDTLIRLFPVRFWQDAFIYVGGLAFALGLGFAFLLKPTSK